GGDVNDTAKINDETAGEAVALERLQRAVVERRPKSVGRGDKAYGMREQRRTHDRFVVGVGQAHEMAGIVAPGDFKVATSCRRARAIGFDACGQATERRERTQSFATGFRLAVRAREQA